MYFANLEYCLKFMKFCGAHPELNKDKLQRFLFFFNVSLNSYIFFMAASSLSSKDGPLQVKDISSVMECLITTSHGTLKLMILKSKRCEILDLLHKTESLWTTEQISNARLRASCTRIIHWLKVAASTMLLLAIVTIILFMISPILGRNEGILVSHKAEEMPLTVAILLEQYALVFSIGIPILCFDVFYQTIVILIQVQFKVLNHEVAMIFKERRATEDTKEMVKLRVDKHNFLLDIVAEMNEAFSIPLIGYIGILSSTICVELFNLTNTGTLSLEIIMKLIIYMVAGIFEVTVFYCLPAQLLINEASRISFETFSNYNWDCSSRHAAFSAGMIIMRGNQSVKLWIGKFAILDLETCLETIKSTFSYYMFLRTIVRK